MEQNDLIKCKICNEILQDPRLCYNCRKGFCKICIEKEYKKNQLYICPLCKKKMNLDEYIPFKTCNDFLDYLKNAYEFGNAYYNDIINIIDNQKKEECEEHNSEVIFYCSDCDKKLCGLCISPYNYEEEIINSNIHQNHNVYKIKDLKKKNLMDVIEEYQKIIKQLNQYQININSFNKKISYIKHFKKINYNSIKEIEKYSNDNISSIIKKILNTKTSISSSESKFENQFPSLNISLKNIIDRKQLDGYKDLITTITDKTKKIESDDSVKKFDGILNEKPEPIFYESIRSSKIILKNIVNKINEEELDNGGLIMSNGIGVKYKIIKVKPQKIRFDVSIKKENDFDKSKYNVSILLKEYNKNEYKSIILKEFNEKPNDPYYFIFYELFSLYNFYSSANSNGDIEIKIVLSKIKNN